MPLPRFRPSQPWLRRFVVAFGLLAACPVLAADIVLYEQDDFRGRSFVADQTISNFANLGFNDRASSVIIRSGNWQLCTDAHFRGRCVTLPPGEYPTLRSMQLENQVSSARELDWQRPGPGGPRPTARVELFEGSRFEGRALPINGPTSSLPEGFNDRASSMVVHEGHWEACENIRYRGACQVYGPGRYATLGGMSNRISSLRPVEGPDTGAWGSGARALLYEGPNLSGRSMMINDEVVTSLAGTGFNDRASSLRIEGGYWIFCTDANFLGACLTFGPGDYRTLPWGVENRISSGRRIFDHYPYSQNPNWQR